MPTKATSPALLAEYKGEPLTVVADSGAELNCLDRELADKLGVRYRTTNQLRQKGIPTHERFILEEKSKIEIKHH